MHPTQFMWTCVVVITYRFSPKKLLSMKTQVQFWLSSVIAKRLFLKYLQQPHIFPLATFIWTHMIVLGLFSCCAVLSVGRHQLKFFKSHNIFFYINLGDWFWLLSSKHGLIPWARLRFWLLNNENYDASRVWLINFLICWEFKILSSFSALDILYSIQIWLKDL